MAEQAAKPADCADLQHWYKPKTHLMVAFAKHSWGDCCQGHRQQTDRQTVKRWLQTVFKHQGRRRQNYRHTQIRTDVQTGRQTGKLLQSWAQIKGSKLRAQTISSLRRSKECTVSRGIQSLPSKTLVQNSLAASATWGSARPPGGAKAQHFTLHNQPHNLLEWVAIL